MSPLIEMHQVDVGSFLSVLDSCEGNVYLVTREGDHLNLKSKLSQLIGLTRLIEGGKIAQAMILCEKQEDETKLFRFNLLGDMSSVKENKKAV